jgi:hypothetical protein
MPTGGIAQYINSDIKVDAVKFLGFRGIEIVWDQHVLFATSLILSVHCHILPGKNE